jgi:hypothetical protein
MLLARSRLSRVLGAALLALVLLAGCGPATRPLRGALPGAGQPTATPAVPPTLSASDPRLRVIPSPSPGRAGGPSPGAAASPSPAPAPPIVRTIQPSANAQVPVGAPVTVAAVLVGRGADLAAATLLVNGAEVAPEIEKTNPRQWAIRATQPLPPGAHTARVFVRDSTGAAGGFTWQFTVGEPEPTPTPAAEGPAEPPPPEPEGRSAPVRNPAPGA